MILCLDTNVVIAFLKGNPPPLIDRFGRELQQGTLALPVITLFELHFGVAKSARRAENAARIATFLTLPIMILPLEPGDAEEAGEIRAALARAGTPIGPYDVLIAGQARRRGAVLVTANTGEFARVPRLRMEDWTVG